MTNSELNETLHAFADGELAGEAERAIREALAQDASAQAELNEIEATRALAREAFLAPVEHVDFSGFADAVMARVAQEERATQSVEGVVVLSERAEQPSLVDRIGAWFRDLFTFERPMVSMAAAAAVAVLVGGAFLATGQNDPTPGTPETNLVDQATPAPEAPAPVTPRRLELEEEVAAGRNAATVESFEVSEGRVLIEGNEADPEQPVVVWHILEEDASGDDDAQ